MDGWTDRDGQTNGRMDRGGQTNRQTNSNGWTDGGKDKQINAWIADEQTWTDKSLVGQTDIWIDKTINGHIDIQTNSQVSVRCRYWSSETEVEEVRGSTVNDDRSLSEHSTLTDRQTDIWTEVTTDKQIIHILVCPLTAKFIWAKIQQVRRLAINITQAIHENLKCTSTFKLNIAMQLQIYLPNTLCNAEFYCLIIKKLQSAVVK